MSQQTRKLPSLINVLYPDIGDRWANMYRGGNLTWWRENRHWTATVLKNEGCPLHWAVLILAGR